MIRAALLPALTLVLTGASDRQPPVLPWSSPSVTINPAASPSWSAPILGWSQKGRSAHVLPARSDRWRCTAVAPSPAQVCSFKLVLRLARPERLVGSSIPVTVHYSFARRGWAHGRISARLGAHPDDGAVIASPGGTQRSGTLHLAIPSRTVRVEGKLKLCIQMTVETRARTESSPSTGLLEIEQVIINGG